MLDLKDLEQEDIARYRELKIKIRKDLCFQPEVEKKSFGFDPGSAGAASPPILFYTWDSAKRHLRVPFRYGVGLTKSFPNDKIERPRRPISFTGQLFDRQVPVAEEAMEHLKKQGATTIRVYPGFGKTILAAYIAAQLGETVLVLAHREILVEQWAGTFLSVTDADVWVVNRKLAPGEVPLVPKRRADGSSGPPPPPEKKGKSQKGGKKKSAKKEEPEIAPSPEPVEMVVPNVLICMDQRWKWLTEEVRDSVGMLVIDEAHTFCTPSRVETILSFRPKYVVAETATLERTDGLHAMIQSVCGTHGIIKISEKPFHVTKLMTGVRPERRTTKQGKIDWAHLVRTTLMREERNELIYSIVQANPSFKILVLTSLVAHAKELSKGLNERGVSADFMAGTKKKYRECACLCASTSKVGTGFDQNATNCIGYDGVRFNLVLMVCSFKKEALLEQCVGRAFRSDSPNVIHFVDEDNIYKSHWRVAEKWYRSRMGEISVEKISPAPEEAACEDFDDYQEEEEEELEGEEVEVEGEGQSED